MKHAAIVRFVDSPNKYYNGEATLTNGKHYNALFTEFFGIKRSNLWIINDLGEAEYFYELEDFEVISDPDGVLKDHRATLKCIKDITGITLGKKYRAIGKNTTDYLICDDWLKTTFFPKEYFEILEDVDGILSDEYEAYNWGQIILNDLSKYKNEPVEIRCHCQRGTHDGSH